MIVKSHSQEVFCQIPKDLIDTGVQSTQSAIRTIVSRIRWESDWKLRIVNLSDIDCIF